MRLIPISNLLNVWLTIQEGYLKLKNALAWNKPLFTGCSHDLQSTLLSLHVIDNLRKGA
jgi:hypothetical protein